MGRPLAARVLEITEYPTTSPGHHTRSYALPTWDQIEAAVRALDHHHLPFLFIGLRDKCEGEDCLSVLGGPKGYAMSAADEHSGWLNYRDPTHTGGEVPVWTSDQGYYPDERYVTYDLELALRVTRYYAEHGRLDPSVQWEPYPKSNAGSTRRNQPAAPQFPFEVFHRMSAIASFYLIDNGDIARLKELATQPVGLVAGGKWHDPYDEFLVARARQLETYGWSGYVIGSEVYFYLESHSASLDDYCDQKLSAHFYEARQNSILVFRPPESRELVQHIETNWPDTTALRAFLDSPDMSSPTHEAAPVEAVFDGLAIMKSWLSQVDEGHVGLLTIG